MKTLLVLVAVGLVSACNTVEGVGKDISAAGNAIDTSASKTKQEMSR